MALVENVRKLAAGLTQKRVRMHALLLGMVLWGAYAVNVMTPGLMDREGQLKGTDFLHFYVLGNVARMHEGSLLYDAPRQAALSRALIHQDAGEVYLPVYGPQFSLLFIPFAFLPYGWAAVAWMLTSATVYGVCCWLVVRVCPQLRNNWWTVLILAGAFPAFFYMVATGQNSALALAAFTAAYFCFRARMPLLAGMAIGVLMYKPQFGVVAAVVFAVTLNWRVIAGALMTGLGQLAIGAAYYGRSALNTYVHSVTHIDQSASALEPHVERMHSLRAFWELLIPWRSAGFLLYAVTALAVVAITVWCWRSKVPLELRYAAFLLGTVLVDPHLTDYDLVILMPAFLLLGEHILESAASAERDFARLLMYCGFCLPLFGTMLVSTHVQLSVPVYAGLFLVVAAMIREKERGQTQLAVASPIARA